MHRPPTLATLAVTALMIMSAGCTTPRSDDPSGGPSDGPSGGHPDGRTEAVRRIELQRLRATLAADLPQLRQILSERLVYCHSSGQCDSSAAYLAKIASGELKYLSLQPVDLQLSPAGSAMLVRGTVDMNAQSLGQNVIARQIYLAVYEQTRGHWQLCAYQSTRMPTAQPQVH